MLKYMDYIYTVYKERNITKAAKKMYISQPWLSNIVKKVEEELQAPLFQRDSGALTLTEAGEFYIRHIEQIIRIRDEMTAYFYERETPAFSTIHIGSGSIFCIYILPKVLKKFCEEHPNIQIVFHEGTNAELIQKLLDHQIDLYIESDAPDNPSLRTIPWAQEELILAVPAAFPLNEALRACAYTAEEYRLRNMTEARPFIPLSVMKDASFISAAPGNDSYQRGIAICQENGFTPKFTFYSAGQLTSYSMACQGIGATFTRSVIPDFLPPTGELFFYRLNSSLAVRDIYLSYAPDRMEKSLQELLNTIQETDLTAFTESSVISLNK